MKVSAPLAAIFTFTFAGSAFAQQMPDIPPDFVDDEPFEEQVYTEEPFETMTDAPPTMDPNAPAKPEAPPAKPTMAEFESALNPHGRWVTTSAYGRVWVPRLPFAHWRPYSHGEWVMTSAGWTFVSHDSWGWAPFHYGRWVYIRKHGWSWIPGYDWSPAWVSWRYGGNYVAWAPLGPAGVAAAYYDTPSLWFTVKTRNFGQRINRRHFLPTSRVRVVIGKTRRGRPAVDFVQAGTGRQINRVSIRAANRRVKKAKRTQQRRDRRQKRARPARRRR